MTNEQKGSSTDEYRAVKVFEFYQKRSDIRYRSVL
jgi:hypothetical protein